MKGFAAMFDMRNLQKEILRLFWRSDALGQDAASKRKRKEAISKDGLVISSHAEGDAGKCVYKYPKILFHYTSREAAVNILSAARTSVASEQNECCFGFTDYRFLNDDREFKLGLEIATLWMKQNPNVFHEVLRNEILLLLEDKAEMQNFIPYVLSFSQESDSTVHWAAYTDRKDGGYALGLSFVDVNREVRSYNDVTREKENMGELKSISVPVLFCPCIYCSVKQLMGLRRKKMLSDEMRLVFNALFPSINHALYESEMFDKNRRKVARWFAERIFYFASLVKSEEFGFEKEWRLVARKDPVASSQVRILGGKPRIVPLGLDLGTCLKEIVVSPHGDSPRLKLLAEIMAEQITGRGIRVRASDSSYNGR